MTRLLLLLVALTACLAQDLSGPVVRVIDGDTIVVELDGRREHVRYIGIDTPEMDDERPAVRRRAVAAREANQRMVEGRTVRLALDAEHRDRYGRLLAYVWVGDTLVNEALVRAGLADPFTVPPNVKYADRFVAAARAAREAAADGAEPANRAPAGGGQDAGGVLAAREAVDHVGELRTVCGRVASARYVPTGRRPTFLNLGRPYPDQDLTVVIWGADRGGFSAAPEQMYEGERICVTGRIEDYRGRPEIIAHSEAAIRIAAG
jgi:micrococcal nuclease